MPSLGGSRSSSSSRRTGGTPISGPLGSAGPVNFGYDVGEGAGGYGVGVDTNDEGEREITGQGGLGFEAGGSSGGNGSINPSGGSPFSPSGRSPTTTPKSGGIDLGKGGRGIDIGKDAASNLDLGKKPPARSPIGIEAGASPAGNLGVGVSIPIGSSPFQGRGGIIIDPNTGEVVGGGIGGGIGFGPLDVSVDVGIDEGGCIQFVTVGIGPFSRTFQRNNCKPNEPNRPSAPSAPSGGGGTIDPSNYEGDSFCIRQILVAANARRFHQYNTNGQYFPPVVDAPTPGLGSYVTVSANPVAASYPLISWINPTTGQIATAYQSSPGNLGYYYQVVTEDPHSANADYYSWVTTFYLASQIPKFTPVGSTRTPNGLCVFSATINQNIPFASSGLTGFGEVFKTEWVCPTGKPTPPPETYTPKSNPLPNTPPRKRKMDDACCKFIAALVAAHGQNISRLLGQPVDVLAQPIDKPIFPTEPLERVVTPKNPQNPRVTEKITFESYKDLVDYLLKQSINLDVALDPQAVDLLPNGTMMMNPLYERPSDITLKENKEPGSDKKGNDRELKVGENIFFPSMLAEQRYIFESIRRLEYLFPAGELADAQISKDLLIPGQKGELKIFNMIHAYEILLQYLSAILGDPREPIILKDTNPAKPGDQGVNISHMSISHLIREMFKFTLDTEGDVDALMMMGIRDFRTNMANRIQIVQIAEMVEALFEDSGMLEKQEYIKLNLEGDPYAGQYVEGKGFEPKPELDEDTEEATEKIVQATLNNKEIKVKVSKRHPKEKTDLRDIIVQLSRFIERRGSIPATEEGMQKAIESAQLKVKTDMALIRQQVKAAGATSRPRTRKKKKP